ncbi:hypothetical protein M378DRAFT_15620, partial [Amanita muscaria Koide BX008]
MEHPPRKPERPKLCDCPKCVRSSDDGKGKILPPRTYRNHAKHREEAAQARHDAFFERFGPPSVPSSSSANVARRRRRPGQKNNSTTSGPSTGQENAIGRSFSPVDDSMDFQQPLTPPNDPIQHAPSPPDDPMLLQPAPSPLDDPISFQCDPGPLDDLLDDELSSPFDPTADEDSEDEDDEVMSHPAREDSEDEDMGLGRQGVPRLPNSFQIEYDLWSVPDEENPLDDENAGGISANNSDDNGNAAHNSSPQPTIPMLILANDMIENIKTARLEDDLPDKMLARLRSPPNEPVALDPITETSMGIFNALVSGSERKYNA